MPSECSCASTLAIFSGRMHSTEARYLLGYFDPIAEPLSKFFVLLDLGFHWLVRTISQTTGLLWSVELWVLPLLGSRFGECLMISDRPVLALIETHFVGRVENGCGLALEDEPFQSKGRVQLRPRWKDNLAVFPSRTAKEAAAAVVIAH
jgi:hypothetical protein